MHLFAPSRPIEFVLKPLITMLTFLLLCVGIEWWYVGWSPIGIQERLIIAGLAMAPFMCVAFILVVYLDRLQASLGNLAMTDALTGLPNRRAFSCDVERYLRSGEVGYLMILDADHFKRINDTYGHPVGDLCLQAIGTRLDNIVAPGDAIGRLGGEEFGIYLPCCTQERLFELSKRLCHQITVPHPQTAALLRFTLSVGATETRPNETVEEGLARADEALYVAKETGRARMVVWKPNMQLAA